MAIPPGPPPPPPLPAWKEAHLVLQDLKAERQRNEWFAPILPQPSAPVLRDLLPGATWSNPVAATPALEKRSASLPLGSREWFEAVLEERSVEDARKMMGVPTPLFGAPPESRTLGSASLGERQAVSGALMQGLYEYADFDTYSRIARGDWPPHLQLQALLNFEREHAHKLSAEERLDLRLKIGELQRMVFHYGSS